MFQNKKHCEITLEDIKRNWEALKASVKAIQEKAREQKETIIPVIGKKED